MSESMTGRAPSSAPTRLASLRRRLGPAMVCQLGADPGALRLSLDGHSLTRAANAFEASVAQECGIALDRRDKELSLLQVWLASAGAAELDPAASPPLTVDMHRGVVESEADSGADAEAAAVVAYALGAWWGDWLVRHAGARWLLSGDLAPQPELAPCTSVSGIACVHPFVSGMRFARSGEIGLLGEGLAEHRAWRRCLPPRVLVARPMTQDELLAALLPEPARRAVEIEDLIGDAETAWSLYRQGYRRDPENLVLLSRMASCAWRLRRWETVDRVSQMILAQVPNHPRTNHNLAVLYVGPLDQPKLRREALRLLHRALEGDPTYGRAHLTLASVLLEEGRDSDAAEHARLALEHAPRLASQAYELLATLGIRSQRPRQ